MFDRIAPLLTLSPMLVLAGAASMDDPLATNLVGDADRWQVVVDGVMGGLSSGRVTMSESGGLGFSGNLSLDNNGGFSQVRARVDSEVLADAEGIDIRVRGDGRTYTFDVRCSNARVMAGSFQQVFVAGGQWTTISLPFDAFRLYSFGQLVGGAPRLDPTKIESIGVTLADKKPGPFELEIASIRPMGLAVTADAPANESVLSRLSARPADIRTLLGMTDAAPVAPSMPSAQAEHAARLIELAINRGAPLYNHGQHAACAAIYEVTIHAMLMLSGDGLDTSVSDRLERALRDAETQSSSTDRAWAYRGAMDDAHEHFMRTLQASR